MNNGCIMMTVYQLLKLGSWGLIFSDNTYMQRYNNSFCVSGKGQIAAMLPHPFCVCF